MPGRQRHRAYGVEAFIAPLIGIHRWYQYSGLVLLTLDAADTFLLYHDLDVLSSGNMPQLYSNLTKNSSIPSVHGGALWADGVNKRLFLFGGEYYHQAPSQQFLLWSYDTINNEWSSFGAPAQVAVSSVSYGAGASVSERGEGYYYGGWMSNDSMLGWSGSPTATSAMIKYDMETNSWTNGTGPDSSRRAEGAMVFIPIGDGGMLVYLGGIQDRHSNGTIDGQPMDKIFLYDVLSSKWYTQDATGAIPQMRRRFCAGAAWAADQSSYNMCVYFSHLGPSCWANNSIVHANRQTRYIYGGAGMPPDTAGFDDIYILTIPTFQWLVNRFLGSHSSFRVSMRYGKLTRCIGSSCIPQTALPANSHITH